MKSTWKYLPKHAQCTGCILGVCDAHSDHYSNNWAEESSSFSYPRSWAKLVC